MNKEGFESFRALEKLAFWPRPSKIFSVLYKYIVPSFIDKFPEGKIYFVKYDDLLAKMNAVARILSDVDIFGVDLLKKNKSSRKTVPRSMRGVHHAGIDAFIENTLMSVLLGFFPYIWFYCLKNWWVYNFFI